MTERDVARLARHFDLPVDRAREKFTYRYVSDGKEERILRHRKDELFGSACRFLDERTRMCTVHAARPGICRAHPGGSTCAYYAFLMAERRYQDDPGFVARAYNPE